MFAEIKEIENEINKFKLNMNSVDGLMKEVREVYIRIENQIKQGETTIKELENIRTETKIELDKIIKFQKALSDEQVEFLKAKVQEQAKSLEQVNYNFKTDVNSSIEANATIIEKIKDLTTDIEKRANDYLEDNLGFQQNMIKMIQNMEFNFEILNRQHKIIKIVLYFSSSLVVLLLILIAFLINKL